jgi:hypothetical protein
MAGVDTERNVDNSDSFSKIHHARSRTDAYQTAITKQPIVNTQQEQSLYEMKYEIVNECIAI